ncbi:unnamed protein product, partial [Cylicostephanus goldi]
MLDENETTLEQEQEVEVEDDEDVGRVTYVADLESSDDEDMEDIEDTAGGHWTPPDTDSEDDDWQRPNEAPKRRRPHVEIEYEDETENMSTLDPATGFTCVACHLVFKTPELQREHYRTDWHRYNLKRQ